MYPRSGGSGLVLHQAETLWILHCQWIQQSFLILSEIAHHLREAMQAAQSGLDVNHAACSIRFAPVLVLHFQPCALRQFALSSNGGGH
jgi:hypothetical protein